jgi:hypothetical protein
MNAPSAGVSPNAARAGRAVGAMFFFAFGGAWLCLWAFSSLASPWPAAIVVAIATVALLALAHRVYRAHAAAGQTAETPEAKRRSRLFNIVNAAQWVLILVVGNVLANMGLSDWILPAVIFIVGLHFLPLARIFANPPHYLTGCALMLLAVVYPLLSPNGANSPVGCLGAGLILWASAAWAVSPYASSVQALDRNDA